MHLLLCTLQALLSKSSTSTSQLRQAFCKAYAHALVPVLVLQQKDTSLDALAAASGRSHLHSKFANDRRALRSCRVTSVEVLGMSVAHLIKAVCFTVLTTGVGVRQLLQQSLSHIYAAAIPLNFSTSSADCRRAAEALQGGVLKRHFSGQKHRGHYLLAARTPLCCTNTKPAARTSSFCRWRNRFVSTGH